MLQAISARTPTMTSSRPIANKDSWIFGAMDASGDYLDPMWVFWRLASQAEGMQLLWLGSSLYGAISPGPVSVHAPFLKHYGRIAASILQSGPGKTDQSQY